MAPSTFRGTAVAKKIVAVVLAIMAIATVVGLIYFWPASKTVALDETMKKSMGLDDQLVYAKVIDEGATECTNSLFGMPLTIRPEYPPLPEGMSYTDLPKGQCPAVTARIIKGEGRGHFVIFNNHVIGNTVSLKPGQTVRLAMDQSEGHVRFVFEDMDRRVPLAVWLGVTALLVLLVGSWKGLRALVGVIVTLAVVVLWILPSIMSGHPAITVAVVGAAAALFLVMFFVHGFSWKTAGALLATLVSVLGAVAMSEFAVRTTHITGMAEDQNVTMQMYMHQLPVVGLLIAGFIIGTIGVLNDVTISQAATVFELVEMDPKASPARIFDSAMRVGRDHIASMLYTLVLAYTGSVLPLLLFIQQSSRGMWEVINGETIAVEIIRSLVGVIALTFCFPLTTAISIWLANVGKGNQPKPHKRAGRKARKAAADAAAETPAEVSAEVGADVPETEAVDAVVDGAAARARTERSTSAEVFNTGENPRYAAEDVEEVEAEIVEPSRPARETETARRATRISPSYVDSRLLRAPQDGYQPRRSRDDYSAPSSAPSTGDSTYTGRRRATENPYWTPGSTNSDEDGAGRHARD